jgi:hypothetical protein
MGCLTSPLDKVFITNNFSLNAIHKPKILFLELDTNKYTFFFLQLDSHLAKDLKDHISKQLMMVLTFSPNLLVFTP